MAQKLLDAVGCTIDRMYVKGGKGELDRKASAYNNSARHRGWLVLRDLDNDDHDVCRGALVSAIAGAELAPGMAFRLAVRAVESWLLADAVSFSSFFGVARGSVPRAPDDLASPKITLVDLCRSSRKGSIHTAVVPRSGSGRAVGAEYTATIVDFVTTAWDPDRAADRSPSLHRALRCLRHKVDTGAW